MSSYRGGYYSQRGHPSLNYGSRNNMSGGANNRGIRQPWYGSSGYAGNNSRYNNGPNYSMGYGDNYSHNYSTNGKKYHNYHNYDNGYIPYSSSQKRYPDESMNPWECGGPPPRSSSKRPLLPTPLSSNLMCSVNELFRLGGTEKQLLDIVDAVVASQESSSVYGNYPPSNNQTSHNRRGGGGGGGGGNSRMDHGYYTNNNNYYSDYSVEPYDYYGNRMNSSHKVPVNGRMKPRSSGKLSRTNSAILTKRKSSSKLSPKKSLEKIIVSKDAQNIPRSALRCHICDINNFTSKETYLAHLKGRSHYLVATVFHARNNAILQMLQANVKIFEMKRMSMQRRGAVPPKPAPVKTTTTKAPAIKTGVKGYVKYSNNPNKPLYCNRCMCEVAAPMKVHMKSVEHRHVHSFINERCCGKLFGYGQKNSLYKDTDEYKSVDYRREIEEHKLSLDHLWNVHKANNAGEDVDDGKNDADSTEEDDVGVALSYLEHLQKEEESKDLLNATNLPPYDPSMMIGVSFIRNRVMRYCRLCKVQFRSSKRYLTLHCQRSDHYDNVVKYLKQEDDKQNSDEKENEDKIKVENGDNCNGKFDESIEDMETESSLDKSENDEDEDDDEEEEEEEEEDDDDDDDDDEEEEEEKIPANGECSDEKTSLQGSPVKTCNDEVLSFTSLKDMPVSWSDATDLEVQNGQTEE